ncbi:hypothetical protein GF373_00705, partial [bacterium]|nr:hypothetical protein [bacterium]
MKSRILVMGVMLTALMVVTGVAQDEDQVVKVQDFETFDAQITGGAVTFAFSEQYANTDVPAPENGGEWGLLAAYDNTGGGTWGQSTITFADPVDLTGMTELHLSIFFTEDSVPNRNGDEIHVRFHWNNQDQIGFPWIKIGEWNDLVFPIDPYASENEIAAFDKLRLIPSAGNEGTGSFMIDNVYAVRPANTPELEIVPVYGFNETNPGEDTPKGWMNHDGLAPILGADYAEPSEGSNCMLLPVDGANIRTAKTINTKADVDWTRVRAVYFDVRVTDDWEGWGNLRYFIESSSGGTYLHSQRRDIDSVKD